MKAARIFDYNEKLRQFYVCCNGHGILYAEDQQGLQCRLPRPQCLSQNRGLPRWQNRPVKVIELFGRNYGIEK